MKHTFSITLLLLALFLSSQFIGIGIIYKYIDQEKTSQEQKTVFKELPIGERPPMEEKTSYFYVILAIIIGTGIFFLLFKYHLVWLWKIWFLLAVVMALIIALAAFIPLNFALFLALAFGFWKVFKPNFLVQNLTELFVYGGLAAIFAPLFNLFSVIILLILISIYDAYSVWRSKHMIKLALSQAKAKVFAGLLLPYRLRAVAKKTGGGKKSFKTRTAILGGGDIGFPLIFAGVVLKEMGLWQSMVIPFFAVLGLALLLWKSKEKKFYPAMPFITLGCLLGLGVVWLISLI